MLHEISSQSIIINMYMYTVKTGLQSYRDTNYSRDGVNQI